MPLLLRGWWRTQNSTRESWWIHVVLLVGRFKRQARPWRHMISMISWKQLRIWTHHSGMTTHSVCIYIYYILYIYILVYIYIYCVYIYIYVRVPWYKRALLHRTSPTNHHENTCDPKNIKGSSTLLQDARPGFGWNTSSHRGIPVGAGSSTDQLKLKYPLVQWMALSCVFPIKLRGGSCKICQFWATDQLDLWVLVKSLWGNTFTNNFLDVTAFRTDPIVEAPPIVEPPDN